MRIPIGSVALSFLAAIVVGCSAAPPEGSSSTAQPVDGTCGPLATLVTVTTQTSSSGGGHVGGGGPVHTTTTSTEQVCARLDGAACPRVNYNSFDESCGGRTAPPPPSPACTQGLYMGDSVQGGFVYACPTGSVTAPPADSGVAGQTFTWGGGIAQSSQTDCGTCYGPLPSGWEYYWVWSAGSDCHWTDDQTWICGTPTPSGGCGSCLRSFPPM